MKSKIKFFDYLEIGCAMLLVLIVNVTAFFYYGSTLAIFLELLLLVCIIRIGSPKLLQFIVYVLILEVIWKIYPYGLNIYLLPMLIAIISSSIIVLLFSTYQYCFSWLRFGVITNALWLLGMVTILLSVITLIIWAYWTNNLGSGEDCLSLIKDYNFTFVILVIIPLFALINAFMEEFVFRGIIQSSLEKIFLNSKFFSNFLQASTYASIHYIVGFPNGKLGYVMTLIYGWLLGFMRQKTKGFFLPYFVHIFGDLTVGYLLLFYSG